MAGTRTRTKGISQAKFEDADGITEGLQRPSMVVVRGVEHMGQMNWPRYIRRAERLLDLSKERKGPN